VTDFEAKARAWNEKADECESEAPNAAAAHRRVASILRECAEIQKDTKIDA
jgi:hypothetical protein